MKRQIAIVAGLTIFLIAIIIMARNRTRPSALLQADRTPVAATKSAEPEAAPEETVDDPVVPGAKKKKETEVSPASDAKKQAPAAPKNPEALAASDFVDAVLVLDSWGAGFVFPSEDLVRQATEKLNLSDSQKARVAAWADWKTKSIEGLSENERNDAKKLKEIDDKYREGVKSELDQDQAEKLEKFFSRHR